MNVLSGKWKVFLRSMALHHVSQCMPPSALHSVLHFKVVWMRTWLCLAFSSVFISDEHYIIHNSRDADKNFRYNADML